MTITRTITVAAGVFAPGHLGELTRIVPFELADAVLEETRTRERRLRTLPSRVGLYFMLALGLFPQAGYLGVWAELTAALDGLGLAVPSPKALRGLRRRLGPAPLRALFEMLAGPLGQPSTPGVRFGRYRTVAFDGCRSLKVPDTPRNRAWLGKMNAALGETGYPVIQLMTLAETGTRALAGAVFGTTADGELDWARKLLHLLDATMLVLMDRGFDAGEFLAQVAAARAQFLVRLNATRRPPVLARLPDGSALSLIGGVKVRIIAASVTITCHDGTSYDGSYRLATTLLDHRAYPAGALIALYHERWEHEIAYLALRHTLLHGRVLRSGDPAGLEQEMWALLALYQALRIAITDAVTTVPGTDPDRASYQIAVQTAQILVTGARNVTTGVTDLAGGIGRAVLANLHGPRRPRVCPRRVKSPLSRWNKHPPGKPRTCQQVTSLTTAITQYRDEKRTRRRRSLTPAPGP
ncbi:MAG TPA: IS4 family transposase [Streptosporangiaceae bacterium]|jgi:Insertion element 4 transposase N-terminal/Transposase DDE domain|nr:IS4 family transposase [Streptosporangiaceae bacterium]